MATNKKSTQNQNQNQSQQNTGDTTFLDNATAMFGGLGDNLSNLPESVKQIGTAAANRFSKLTTTQKVIGGAALLIGAGYLVRRTNLINWNSLGQIAKMATGGNGQKNKNK